MEVKQQFEALDREIKEFLDEFLSASERAAVLIGGSFVDDLLGQILRRALRPSSSRDDDLFDGDKPLSTFSAKIILAHRLGVIDDQMTAVLHLLRKTRNEFAHKIVGCSLVLSPHRDRMREMCHHLKSNANFQRYIAQFEPLKKSALECQFAALVVVLMSKLVVLRENISQLAFSPETF